MSDAERAVALVVALAVDSVGMMDAALVVRPAVASARESVVGMAAMSAAALAGSLAENLVQY